MNIFVLSSDPVEAAQMQCDQHVVKMPLESAQILCAIFPEGFLTPYLKTHLHHPATLWAKAAEENYEWLLAHALALCDEYEFRYGKVHASKEVVLWCWAMAQEALSFPQKRMTPFVAIMDEDCKEANGDVIESYRNFYRQKKRVFARWQNKRLPPFWF